MIHYQLRCAQEHEFDGWFNDSAGFERQAKRGLIDCPTCGDTKVTRALMAPSLTRRDARPAAERETAPAPAPVQQVLPPEPPPGMPMPARLVAMLQRMRAEVEKTCDNVGPAFAEEARKIHYGEAEPRGIYGETSPYEAEALADEGIEVHNLPWVPRAD